nr:MAG TPA: hypothetical protein [Caudoviricetes sp.]
MRGANHGVSILVVISTARIMSGKVQRSEYNLGMQSLNL